MPLPAALEPGKPFLAPFSAPGTKTKRGPGNDKHQKIIRAAIRIFSEKGFHSAKIADVAKAAEVADGTIYLYFKSKDDLLISVFESSIDLFIQTVSEALAAVSSPLEKLKMFVLIYFQLIKKYPELSQVIQLELRQSAKFMKEYSHSKFMSFLGIVANILEDGQREGLFRSDVNPQIIRRALFGAIDEIALEWLLMKKKKYTAEEAAEQLGRIFIEGLLTRKKESASLT